MRTYCELGYFKCKRYETQLQAKKEKKKVMERKGQEGKGREGKDTRVTNITKGGNVCQTT